MSGTVVISARGFIAEDLVRGLRGTAWYVAYGAALLLSLVAAFVLSVFEGFSSGHLPGLAFSGAIFVVLGLGVAVLPLLAGAALAGPAPGRPNESPAHPAGSNPTRRVFGTWVARWVLASGLLVAASPVLVVSAVVGGTSFPTFVTAVLACLVETGLVAAICVGLSGVTTSRVGAVLLSFAAVALLTVGTAIAAPLTGSVGDVTETVTTVSSEYDEASETVVCLDPTTVTTTTATALPNWVALVVNPFVLVADVTARDTAEFGQPRDGFGTVAKDVRQAQSPQPIARVDDECGDNAVTALPQQPIESWGAPVWYVGLGVQLVVAAAALLAGIAAMRRRERA
ncbi:hypothetical protein [Herbiconiux sp. UC225_62]|uniref:hypothetical protein n=1 Tax=Herbiconiux sp. UC225_62 TaxID=3350168 RepID=UPI0036D2EA6F